MSQQRNPRGPHPRTNLNTLIARAQTQVQVINDYDGPVPAFDDEVAPIGQIYIYITTNNLVEQTTNFTLDGLLDFFASMQPFIVDAGVRGPKCKSPPMDQLLCYLIWAKLGANYDTLGQQFSIKANRLEANINRMRDLVNKTCRLRWWAPRARPEFHDASPFPHVALLLDHHTTHVYRPKAPFGEGKIYWDGHNKIYGVKNLVGISATKPNYCQFVCQNDVGSVSDYTDLKVHFGEFMEWLQKTPEEMHHLQGDLQHRYWAAVADRAYVGPATDTPNLRRITPKKGNHLSIAELARNEQIDKFRVPIECFFGRVTLKWAIAREIYRWDHKNLQRDFENVCLLTNEDIKSHDLAEVDYQFHKKHRALLVKRTEDKEQLRSAQYTTSRENKRQRLAAVDACI